MLLALCALALADPPVRLDLSRAIPTAEALDLTFDPAKDTFHGTADIEVQLLRRASSVVLNAVDLTIEQASLFVGGQARPVTVRGSGQTRTFAWSGAVDGAVRLHLRYSGKVVQAETQAVFHEREAEQDFIYTQFEAIDARRAFPCFDEPDSKIPWSLVLHVPAGDGAFANMPAVEDVAEPGGHRVTFAPTPKLPSYLVAFTIGPFDIVPGVDAPGPYPTKVPIRILVPHGQAGMAAYAASSTPEILGRLEAWFGMPYPFPKLDVVAMPEAVGFEAMENPGLVTVAQNAVTVRPEDDSVEHDREYADTLAHELAHMWFGDLVTMNFWDDVWLNESFASWMATKTVDAWHPEWQEGAARVASRDGAMRDDSLETARRIREPIVHTEDIEDAFDGITYEKGQAILEMFEAWLGPDTFRTAVQGYLRAHAFGNATADDFIRAVAETAGKPVQPAFSSFLDQVGVPLVDVTLRCEGQPPFALQLQQSRYRPLGGHSRQQRWHIPVCFRYGTGEADAAGSRRECVMLDQPALTVPLVGATCPAWVVPDDNATGYYHVRLHGTLADDLLGRRAPLSLPERVGALGNATALVNSGDVLPTVVLAAVPELVATGEPHVIGETLGVVGALDQYLVPDDLRSNYDRFVLATYGPLARRLGLLPLPTDDTALRDLRADVIGMVGRAGDQPVRDATRVAADRWLADRTGIDPSMTEVVLRLAAFYGDQALFDRIHAQAGAETDRNRKELLLAALAAFRDPDLAQQTLGLAVSGEFDIREAYPLLIGPLRHRETREVAWKWLQAHIDAVSNALPPIARGYIPMAGSLFCDAQHREDVRAFFTPRVPKWVGGRHRLAETLETIDNCAARVEEQEPDVREFLNAQ